jgi:tetratricopeptide (TPR) repeat protein
VTEPRHFPFGSIPVYNPQSLSKTEALAQFHVRQDAYRSLLDVLREERPSHVLIIGTRGMGKTTLLQRVRYGVEDEAELKSRYLVLVFPEEQYNVNRLHHFLLNTVDALADAIERLKNQRMLTHVEEYADIIGKRNPEEIEEEVPRFLAEISQQMQKSILLLVDNADRLFETIEDRQQWRLRELLSSRRDLTFFGATTQASEGIYGQERAFFEFFKIYRLERLTFAEVRALLLRLSESVEENESEKGTAKRRVSEWLDADAARLRTLVQLTGGNPRTTVLLFHLVLDGLAGGAREYLEQLLDQVTPNYKSRVDELPPQAQQVLDAVALRWDPVTAMEVAEDTGLETSAVSTHLTRLVRQGILEKADPGDSKKALYQVAERFFNIWYLMRASRRVRAKLRWFVEFLRVFFEPSELEQMAWQRIERYRSTWRGRPEEIETAFAYVLASGAGRDRFEGYLRQKCADIEDVWRPYLDLIEGQMIDGKRTSYGLPRSQSETEKGSQGDLESQVRQAIEADPENAAHWRKLALLLAKKQDRSADAEGAYRKAIDLDPKSARNWGELGRLLRRIPERREEAEVALRKAIQLDPKVAWFWYDLGIVLAKTPGQHADAERAYRKAVELNSKLASCWSRLGDLLAKDSERTAEAEAAYREAVEVDPNFGWFWDRLGDLLANSQERSSEAETAYHKAIELDPKVASFWNDLGRLLARSSKRRAEAEAAYHKAIELDPKVARFWNDLGRLLARSSKRRAEAEAAYREAIELNPKVSGSWNDLGLLLAKIPKRRAEAETAYRKAIELDPTYAGHWNNLGNLLVQTPKRTVEAEAAYRKAIELDSTHPVPWDNLGSLLAEIPERRAEAETAYRKAIELDPRRVEPWHNLGYLLAEIPETRAEAETIYRKVIDLDPKNALSWGKFGVFLACQAGRPKDAEVAFRTSVQLGLDDSFNTRNFGVLLYCELGEPKEAEIYLTRSHKLDPENPVSTAILAASLGDSEGRKQFLTFMDAVREADFWNELLDLCQNYPPFGKILLGICDLVQERDNSNGFVRLYRAVALAQIQDFPRASVALEDALTGDPINLFSIGQKALETFLAAAVKCGRVRDCLELIDKKEWKDAWRPIYEALRAVEAGSAEYLKRIAVEIRDPALLILRRIAPQLPELPEKRAN